VKRISVLILLVAAVAVSAAAANASQLKVPKKWQNCSIVNDRYPHGVGKNHAHDHTSGVPVTNFKHSTKLYNQAIHANKSLDRDHDGIACEKL
jgi:Excalibur calcium-binding domain